MPTIKEVKEKAITDAKYDIKYYSEKLEHAKTMLELLTINDKYDVCISCNKMLSDKKCYNPNCTYNDLPR